MNESTPPRRGLLAAGNWIIDHVKLIDAWPPQDALASILEQSWGNGGSPYNVLKDLARLGAPFPLAGIGLVGDDADGRTILDDCRAHGIDTTRLRRQAGAATSYTDVMTVRDSGRRTFFHQRGANALLDVEHFDFRGTHAAWFHLGYLLLLDRLDAPGADGRPRAAEVLRRAAAAGMRTSVDVVSEHSDRAASVVRPVMPLTDFLFTNDFEAEKASGVALRPDGKLRAAAVVEAARALLAAGVRSWVVLHFPEGVYARSKTGEEHWHAALALPPEAIAGAAGAGDALAAAMLWGLHDGRPMSECLHWGICAATSSLTHSTCSGGVGPLADCLALADRYGPVSLPQ